MKQRKKQVYPRNQASTVCSTRIKSTRKNKWQVSGDNYTTTKNKTKQKNPANLNGLTQTKFISYINQNENQPSSILRPRHILHMAKEHGGSRRPVANATSLLLLPHCLALRNMPSPNCERDHEHSLLPHELLVVSLKHGLITSIL